MPAKDYSPQDIVNPNINNRGNYIADPENLLDPVLKEQLNRYLYDFRKSTTVEYGIVVVPSIGDLPIEDFSEKVFTEWGLGKADKNNGILLVITTDPAEFRIQTGYGVEGAMPDITAKKIIDSSIIPAMRKGDINAAVASASKDIIEVLSDPVVVDELRSGRRDKWEEPVNDINEDTIISLLIGVIIFIFLFSFGLFIYDARRLRKADRYQKAIGWHDRQSTYKWLAIGSLGLGVIPWLLARRMYHNARNKPFACSTCGTKMKKLNEEEDNALLSPGQDLEERLQTVDYDVWVCPECGTVERYPFRLDQKLYSECPSCHTVAMALVRDHTITPATTRRAGEGERIYECKFCHNRTRKRYVIPKKEDGTAAALAAGAILGSMNRGGRGGGFGGGFGGGRTGGGGATGRL